MMICAGVSSPLDQVQVEFLGPGGLVPLKGLDPARQVVNLLEPPAAQHLGRHPAAAPYGAVHQGGFFRVQFLIGVRQPGQGQELRPGKVRIFVFPGLAHVQQGVLPFPAPGHERLGLLGIQGTDRSKELFQLHHWTPNSWLRYSEQLMLDP